MKIRMRTRTDDSRRGDARLAEWNMIAAREEPEEFDLIAQSCALGSRLSLRFLNPREPDGNLAIPCAGMIDIDH